MSYRMIIRWSVELLLALVVLAVVAYVWGGGFFSSVSVCSVCGAERYSTDWLWVFPVQRVKQTPLSDYVRREGIQTSHEHKWLFGSGGGAGVKCAIGDGRHLFRIIRDADFQSFLAAVEKYRGVQEAKVWLSIGLDPKRVNDVSICFHPDGDAVKDQAGFDRWFKGQSAEWKSNESLRLGGSTGQPTSGLSQ
jgi:hypothetical protein